MARRALHINSADANLRPPGLLLPISGTTEFAFVSTAPAAIIPNFMQAIGQCLS
jgi:hypothetical protein